MKRIKTQIQKFKTNNLLLNDLNIFIQKITINLEMLI